jgi:hypothetical protein
MSLEDETSVDPTPALDGASRLTSVGDRLLSRWQSLRAKIDGLNTKAPWGNDEVGKKFNEHYLNGGDKAPAHNVLEVGENLVKALAKLGPQVTDGVQGTQDVDDLSAQWFGKK